MFSRGERERERLAVDWRVCLCVGCCRKRTDSMGWQSDGRLAKTTVIYTPNHDVNLPDFHQLSNAYTLHSGITTLSCKQTGIGWHPETDVVSCNWQHSW